jgi:3-methyladenine DNA glycosylase AlkD
MEIIKKIQAETKKIGKTATGTHIKVKDLRKLTADIFKNLEDKSIENVLFICEELLKLNDYAMKVVAYDFAYRVRKQYNENTFAIFENWLLKYVRDWNDCDDFCTHAFSELLLKDKTLTNKIVKWTKSHEFAVRRAAAVITIPLIRKNRYKDINPLGIANLLLNDEHDLVQKGCGWMLKVYGEKEPAIVFEYLKKNRQIMKRVTFRYALEKLPAKMKKELMAL